MPARRFSVIPQGGGVPPQTATPSFSPVAGSYAGPQLVAINCATSGAVIYFTIGAVIPTPASAVYSGPITVPSTETLNAVALAPGCTLSAVNSATYNIASPQCATPTFSPPAGNYLVAQAVALACSTPSSSIFFTTNGTTPTTGSTPYTTPISVSTAETVQAIATAPGFTQSAVGSAAYTFNQPAGLRKFGPGHYGMAGNGLYDTTPAQALSDIKQMFADAATAGVPIGSVYQGYEWGAQWASYEKTVVSTSPIYDHSTFWKIANLMAAIWPTGKPCHRRSGNHYTNTNVTASQLMAANMGGGGNDGFFIPHAIQSCGGSLQVLDGFGLSTSKTYPVAPIATGSPNYGMNFQDSNGTTFQTVTPQWYNPGITQMFINAEQSFWASQGPTPAVWASGTTFSPGLQATSGGNTYTYINSTASAGNVVTNTTFWALSDQRYVGKTPDQILWGSGFNDEVSNTFTSSANIPGITVNPPSSVTGGSPSITVSPTNTAFWTQYVRIQQAAVAAAPTTSIAPIPTFGWGAGSSIDSATNMAANWSANCPSGNRSAPIALSTIAGLALCAADTYGFDFNATNNRANNCKQGFDGIVIPGAAGGALPSPTVANLIGLKRVVSQVQAADYFFNVSGAGNNASAVTQVINAGQVLRSPEYRWCQVAVINSSRNVAFPSYLFATLLANPLPAAAFWRPVDDMIGVTVNSVTVASATSLTVTWTPYALDPAEQDLGYSIYRNGTRIASGQTSGAFTDLGLTTGTTYTYTIGMDNFNGAGPQGSGVSGTPVAPSWKTLPVGSGGFVRGMNIAADGTMVARTDTNGAYLYNGTKWNQLFNLNSLPSSFLNSTDLQLVGQGVFEIQIAPSNTQIFYGVYDGFVWVSSNQGATWTQTAFPQNTAGMNPNDNTSAGTSQISQHMAIDPHNSNIVFVGTSNNGLWFTINGGTSWTQIATGTLPFGGPIGITGILYYANGPVTGGVTQTLYAFSSGHGLYVSTNAGSTWTLTSGGPTAMLGATIDSSGNYYVGNATGAFKYNGTWTTMFTDGNGIQAIASNPLQAGELVALRPSGWINVSYDSGATWSGANFVTTVVSTDIPWLANANGQTNTMFLDVGGLAFSPVTNGLLMNSAGVGMWKTNIPASGFNGGTAISWNDFSVGIEQLVANEIVVAPTSGSTPLIASWDRPFFNIASLSSYPSTYGPAAALNSIQMGWSLDYASSSPGTIFGWSTHFGVNQSGVTTNNGVSWTAFASQWSTSEGGSIAASTPSNIIVSPDQGSQPGYTLNGGASWTGITLPGVSGWSGYMNNFTARTVAADRVNANTFYLYYIGVGVYTSTNGGATWTQQKSGSIDGFNGFIYSMRSVPGNAGHLFYTPGIQSGQTLNTAGTAPFSRSTNGGVTWTTVSNVLGVIAFNFGAIAPGKTYPSIYIVGFVGGVFGCWFSTDNAVTWTNLGNPFSSLSTLVYINSIAADPNNFGSVYLGTQGGGYVYFG